MPKKSKKPGISLFIELSIRFPRLVSASTQTISEIKDEIIHNIDNFKHLSEYQKAIIEILEDPRSADNAKDIVSFLHILVRCLNKQEKSTEALAVLGEKEYLDRLTKIGLYHHLETDKRSVDDIFTLAVAHSKLGNDEKARQYFIDYLNIIESPYKPGITIDRIDDYKKVLYRPVTDKKDEAQQIEFFHSYACFLCKSENYIDALEICDHPKFKNIPKFFPVKLRVLAEQNQFDEVINAGEEYLSHQSELKLDSKTIDHINLSLAFAYQTIGDYENALKCCECALLKINKLNFAIRQISCFIELQDFIAAREILTRFDKDIPTIKRTKVYLDYNESLKNRDQKGIEDTIKIIDEYLENNPSDLEFLLLRANCLEFLGNLNKDYSNVLLSLNKILAIDPNHRNALLAKARVFKKCNQYREATNQYSLLLEKYPNDPKTLKTFIEFWTELNAAKIKLPPSLEFQWHDVRFNFGELPKFSTYLFSELPNLQKIFDPTKSITDTTKSIEEITAKILDNLQDQYLETQSVGSISFKKIKEPIFFPEKKSSKTSSFLLTNPLLNKILPALNTAKKFIDKLPPDTIAYVDGSLASSVYYNLFAPIDDCRRDIFKQDKIDIDIKIAHEPTPEILASLEITASNRSKTNPNVYHTQTITDDGRATNIDITFAPDAFSDADEPLNYHNYDMNFKFSGPNALEVFTKHQQDIISPIKIAPTISKKGIPSETFLINNPISILSILRKLIREANIRKADKIIAHDDFHSVTYIDPNSKKLLEDVIRVLAEKNTDLTSPLIPTNTLFYYLRKFFTDENYQTAFQLLNDDFKLFDAILPCFKDYHDYISEKITTFLSSTYTVKPSMDNYEYLFILFFLPAALETTNKISAEKKFNTQASITKIIADELFQIIIECIPSHKTKILALYREKCKAIATQEGWDIWKSRYPDFEYTIPTSELESMPLAASCALHRKEIVPIIIPIEQLWEAEFPDQKEEIIMAVERFEGAQLRYDQAGIFSTITAFFERNSIQSQALNELHGITGMPESEIRELICAKIAAS